MVVHHNTKFGYKRLPKSIQPEWEEIFVSHVAVLTT